MRMMKFTIPDEMGNLEEMFGMVDPLYGEIYIAPEHIAAWRQEFDTESKAQNSLIEEMAELIQAINKYKRFGRKETRDAVVSEMAHVLIGIRGLIEHMVAVDASSIEEEIHKKWPEAYEPKKGELMCDAIGSCGGFVKKKEET